MALSDPDPAKGKLAAELGVTYYRDYREMIDQEQSGRRADLVPNEAHDAVGVECAARGLHLFMEKPIASSLEAADRLIGAARANQVQLYVAHHRRFNPRINRVRQALRDGELGELVGVSVLWCMYKPSEYFAAGPWRAKKGGGPILINTIHEIDLLRYLHGEFSRVYAEVSNKSRGFEVEDTVSVSMRFQDGALASILMSDAAPSLWGYESTAGENPFFYPTKGDLYHFLGRKASLTFPGLVKVVLCRPRARGLAAPHQHAAAGGVPQRSLRRAAEALLPGGARGGASAHQRGGRPAQPGSGHGGARIGRHRPGDRRVVPGR